MAKRRDMVIGGYAETKIDAKTGRSAYDLAGEALHLLLESTGIDKKEIDGMAVSMPLSEASNPFFGVYLNDALGFTPSWLELVGLGGGSPIGGVARAMSAIRDGHCKAAVVIAADAPSTSWKSNYGAYRPEFQDLTGVGGPPAMFGLLLSRYAHQYALKYEALGKIAITQRDHAVLNENAYPKFRKPLTMEDYLKSRVVSDPLRILDSVMFCDGANAVLVTSDENAARLGLKKKVFPVAYAEMTHFNATDPCPDITHTGHGAIAPRLYAQAGLKPSDIRMFHPYDDFTVAVMMQFEDFGFCRKGEGSAFVMDTDLSYKGTLPLNTGGGQISAGQPGLAGGGVNLVEAVRQMFGEAGARQVSDPRNALVTGIGTIPYGRNWGVNNALILEV